MHHIRNSGPREWLEFAENAEAKQYTVHFDRQANRTPKTLLLRQYDIKQNWSVVLNEHDLGSLVADEKDMLTYYSIPERVLMEKNTLIIRCSDATPDDILVGSIVLDTKPMATILTEAVIDFEIVDESETPIPGRITIVNADGVLQAVLADHDKNLAIRTGYVYTGNGIGSVTTAAGAYTLYATRGSEYSVDSIQIVLNPGDRFSKRFTLTHEVPTDGWVSSDTHLHTYTHSGHGDASERERVLTIAGEGVELPVFTDHNVQVDLEPMARASDVRQYFTPVIGNEVTTKVGHFNIFPTTAGTPVADHRVDDWNQLSRNIRATNARAVILNHGRDTHNNFRPFDPKRYFSAAGLQLDNQEFFANAMEVINSGSQQTEIMRLFYDWFGLLNRGYSVTPVGSSDSHDVSRFFAGQARTYIQCADEDPGNIDVAKTIENFVAGRVMVSLGLITTLTVNDLYGPGDLVPVTDTITISAEVLGPGWLRADKITLYANGTKIRETSIPDGTPPGLKWQSTWKLPRPTHDVFLVAIAEGPAGKMPYWPIAKPYQPASSQWQAKVMGSSGAVWIDADKDGKATSAYAYAFEIVKHSKGDIPALIHALAPFDQPIALQAAALLWKNGENLRNQKITNALKKASSSTRVGFETAINELK